MITDRFSVIAWDQLQARHDQINAQLIAGINDNNLRSELQKELFSVTNLLTAHQELRNLQRSLQATQAQLTQTHDQDLIELFREELADLTEKIKSAEAVLDDLLFPPDPLDNSDVFLEIRAGAGGQEAALFAYDLLRMYSNYALMKNWHVSIMSASQTDLKGYKEVVINITGKNVYGHLKRESGVHRVQRVPATEASGRIHTSAVTVAVLPEMPEATQVEINPSDLRIDVFRASGAGGQHVNTTDSAVRITHLPSGIVVSCQDERSQHKNKAKALKALQSKLVTEQNRVRDEEARVQRKSLIGTGDRSEKIRTYNYPQNRVSDHQVNLTLNKLDIIMEGNLEELIIALIQYDREMRRAEAAANIQKK